MVVLLDTTYAIVLWYDLGKVSETVQSEGAQTPFTPAVPDTTTQNEGGPN